MSTDHKPLNLLQNPVSSKYFNDLLLQAYTTNKWAYNEENFFIWRDFTDLLTTFFYVLPETDEVKCGIAMVRTKMLNGENLYYIAYYYWNADYRNLGYGNKIFQMCMEVAGEDNIKLHSVFDMVGKYKEKYGFKKISSHKHGGIVINFHDFQAPDLEECEQIVIKDVCEVEENKVLDYDRKISGQERSEYLMRWITTSHSKIAVGSDGQVIGIITLRLHTDNFICVGPFYADSEDIALHLIVKATQDCPYWNDSAKLFMKFRMNNDRAHRLCSRITNKQVEVKEGSQVMCTKKIPEVAVDKVFSTLIFGAT